MNRFTESKSGQDPRPEGKSRRETKAQTRARILEVAKQQLEQVGYERTNIRGIAQLAGVATGTVLLHFSDKRDLLHAALFDDLAQTWQAARDGIGERSLAQELSAIARAFFGYYAARPALSRALLRESLFAEPPWSARFAAQVAEVHQHIGLLVERAKTRSEIAASANTDVFGATFFSFYYFALLAWVQGGSLAPERLFEAMLHTHLAALTPPGTPPTPKKRARK